MAEWPCCHDPLRFSPWSPRFRASLLSQTKSGQPSRASAPFLQTTIFHCLGAGNLGFPHRDGKGAEARESWGFHAAPNIWGFQAAPKIWGFHAAPKCGVSRRRRPKCGVSRRRPNLGFPCGAENLGFPPDAQSLGFPCGAQSLGFPCGAQNLGFPCGAKMWGSQAAPKIWGFRPAQFFLGFTSRAQAWGNLGFLCRAQAGGNLGFPRRAPTETGGAQAWETWGFRVAPRPKPAAPKPGKTGGFQVTPRPGETCGFHVAPRPKPAAPKPAGTRGFPCHAQAWEAWGFHVAPLMEPRVSAFYDTRETRGTWGFHDDANQLASLGNLGCFETAAQVWGTRCFHVAAHPESPESLWNFRFPCRGATKSRQSPRNPGCPFRGAMKTATQVSGHTLGFHFASQQKLLPKSGKHGVRTCGSVSPRRCEVRTLRPKCGKGHKYNAH